MRPPFTDGKAAVDKKFDDRCEANGQPAAASARSRRSPGRRVPCRRTVPWPAVSPPANSARRAAWNAGKPADKGEFTKLSVPYAETKPGKLACTPRYKDAHGAG